MLLFFFGICPESNFIFGKKCVNNFPVKLSDHRIYSPEKGIKFWKKLEIFPLHKIRKIGSILLVIILAINHL